jgi:hypothetical protein
VLRHTGHVPRYPSAHTCQSVHLGAAGRLRPRRAASHRCRSRSVGEVLAGDVLGLTAPISRPQVPMPPTANGGRTDGCPQEPKGERWCVRRSATRRTITAQPGRAVVARTHDEEEEEMSPEPTTTTTSADALTSRLTRTVLQQSPSSIPGREIVQVLTDPARRRVRLAHPSGRGGRVHRGGNCPATTRRTAWRPRACPKNSAKITMSSSW